MNEQDRMRSALRDNLAWFADSGVMDPSDGSWGVAERILLTAGNEAIERIRTSFPAYVEFDGYCVLEHRRADCNFETALAHWLAERCLNEPRCGDVCRNILRY
ncbi:MAG: hypothetical protein J7M14_04175, partial [Planctomycetes bacterium]|nr:hypothetical protein [Planctomycetota bacterium]